MELFPDSVLAWLSEYVNSPFIGVPQVATIRQAFQDLGIDFSVLSAEDLVKLGKYTNRSKGPVVSKLIGAHRKAAYKAFCQRWA